MQNRHLLALSLEKEICDQHTQSALSLIDLISQHPIARLDSLDNEGKSLLSHALEVGQKEVADKLLVMLADNPKLFFIKDTTNRNCFFYAIQRGYVDIVTKLYELSHKEDKIWQQIYDEGNSALHIAAETKNISIIHFLLKIISQHTDAINIINRFNEERKTPLHLALSAKTSNFDKKVIALFIQQGADLSLSDKNNNTPFSLILSHPFADQIALFTLLKKIETDQFNPSEIFLSFYRNAVIINHNDSILLNQYYQLSLRASLRKYVAAKLEFDNEMDIRNFYYYPEIHPETNENILVAKPIPNLILKLMPLYKNKIKVEKNKVKEENESVLIEIDSSSEEESVRDSNIATETSYGRLRSDLETLDNLIARVTAYLATLTQSPFRFSSLQVLTFIMTVYILIYVPVESTLGVMNPDKPNKQDPYYIASTVFGFVGGVGLLFLFGALIALYSGTIDCNQLSIARNVYRKEWEELTNSIRELLLEPLLVLEKEQLQPTQSYAQYGISEQIIRDLENDLAALDVSDRNITDLTLAMNSLVETLKKIEEGILLSNKPFSITNNASTLFYKSKRNKGYDHADLRIDMKDSYSSQSSDPEANLLIDETQDNMLLK